jgi:hypothetical protein
MGKKFLLLLLVLTYWDFSLAQVTITQVTKKKETITNQQYDSLNNFLGQDAYKYIGQELYVKGMKNVFRDQGYTGFYNDYLSLSMSTSNIYKWCKELYTYRSSYDSLVGKYFKVLAVIKDPKATGYPRLYETKYFLKLKEKVSGDIVFYNYNSIIRVEFPFIIEGYFEKQKELNMNREFVLRGRNWLNRLPLDSKPILDINTGETVSLEVGSQWKCIDFTLDEKNYDFCLIIENNKGEKILMPANISYDSHYTFSAKEAEKYQVKFGKTNWFKILRGTVAIGFTEEMVLLSWGTPDRVNRTSYDGDQWVYDDKYLYFENGKLQAFN